MSSDPSSRQPQPKIAPRGPDTRQGAAKEAALDVFYNAKSMAADMVEDFRASDRFFKYKAGVIGSWALLAVLALFVSFPTGNPQEQQSNSLDARVLIKQVPALDRSITALYIENSGSDNWGVTVLTLNNSFTHALADLKAGGKAVVTLEKFSGTGGKTPPSDTRPQKLDIKCDRGSVSIDLTLLPK
jgi:hypothetical protein